MRPSVEPTVLTVLVAAALLGGGPAEARCGSGYMNAFRHLEKLLPQSYLFRAPASGDEDKVQDNFRQVRRSLLCFLREELEASRLSCEALSPTGPGYSISEALQQVLENLEYQPENCAKEVELARCNSQDLRVFFTVRHFKEKYRRACTGTEDRSDSFLMELCRGVYPAANGTPSSSEPLPTTCTCRTTTTSSAPTDNDPAPTAGTPAPTVSDPASTARNTTPTASDPAPTASDPASTARNTTPTASDPAPTASDPAPTASDPASTACNTTPTASDPAPTASNRTPTVSDPAPTVSDPAPTARNTTPTASNRTPTVSDPAPTASDPAPTACNTTPTASDPAPTASDPAPTACNTTPTASDRTPTASDPAPTASNRTPTASDSVQKTSSSIREKSWSPAGHSETGLLLTSVLLNVFLLVTVIYLLSRWRHPASHETTQPEEIPLQNCHTV